MPDPFDPLSYTDPAAYEEKKRREQMLAMGLPPQVRTSSGSPIQNFHPAVQAYLAQNQPGQQAPPSHLVEAIQGANRRPMPKMGHTFGFGLGETSPGAADKIAKAIAGIQPTSTPGGLTASQKRQLAVPQQPKSILQQAIDDDMPFGTAAQKNQRAMSGFKELPDGGRVFGSRSIAYTNPDGSVSVIGGKATNLGGPLDDPKTREELGKESNLVERRVSNVQNVIKRKNAMEDKLAANRAAKAAANKAKNTPEFASSEPKSAVQAGMQAVYNAVKQNPALKFNEQSKVAIYQTAVQDYANKQKLDAELENTKLTQKGFAQSNFSDLMKALAPGLMSNPDGSFVDQETMMERFAAAAPLIGAFQAMMGGNGGIPQVGAPPASGVSTKQVKQAEALVEGLSPAEAAKTLREEQFPQEVIDKVVEEKLESATPRQAKEAKEKIRRQTEKVPVRKPNQKLPGLAGELGLRKPSWPWENF